MNDTRKVLCAKFKVSLPGLKQRPFSDDLGQRIYEQVSQDAWGLWLKEMTKIINEYRLSMRNVEHQAYLRQVMVHFLFGEGEVPPPPNQPAPIKFV